MSHGDSRASADWMRAAISRIDFSTSPVVLAEGPWQVHVDTCLTMGWVSVKNTTMRIVFGPTTWDALALCPEVRTQVLADLYEGSSGLKMLTADIVQKLVRVQELGITREDELDRLETLARQLIVESANINARVGVSTNEVAIFTLRSSQLQDAFKVHLHRVLNLQGVIDASTDAVEGAL